jgi:hypothetical protein
MGLKGDKRVLLALKPSLTHYALIYLILKNVLWRVAEII